MKSAQTNTQYLSEAGWSDGLISVTANLSEFTSG